MPPNLLKCRTKCWGFNRDCGRVTKFPENSFRVATSLNFNTNNLQYPNAQGHSDGVSWARSNGKSLRRWIATGATCAKQVSLPLADTRSERLFRTSYHQWPKISGMATKEQQNSTSTSNQDQSNSEKVIKDSNVNITGKACSASDEDAA